MKHYIRQIYIKLHYFATQLVLIILQRSDFFVNWFTYGGSTRRQQSKNKPELRQDHHTTTADMNC